MVDCFQLLGDLYRNTAKLSPDGPATGIPLSNMFLILNGCKTVSDLYKRLKAEIEGKYGLLTRYHASVVNVRLINIVSNAFQLGGYSKENLDRVYMSFAMMLHPLILNELASIEVDHKANAEKRKRSKLCDSILKTANLEEEERLIIERVRDRHREQTLDTFKEDWALYLLTQGGGEALKDTEDLLENAIIKKTGKKRLTCRIALVTYWYDTLNARGDSATEGEVASLYNKLLGSVSPNINDKDVNYYRSAH